MVDIQAQLNQLSTEMRLGFQVITDGLQQQQRQISVLDANMRQGFDAIAETLRNHDQRLASVENKIGNFEQNVIRKLDVVTAVVQHVHHPTTPPLICSQEYLGRIQVALSMVEQLGVMIDGTIHTKFQEAVKIWTIISASTIQRLNDEIASLRNRLHFETTGSMNEVISIQHQIDFLVRIAASSSDANREAMKNRLADVARYLLHAIRNWTSFDSIYLKNLLYAVDLKLDEEENAPVAANEGEH